MVILLVVVWCILAAGCTAMHGFPPPVSLAWAVFCDVGRRVANAARLDLSRMVDAERALPVSGLDVGRDGLSRGGYEGRESYTGRDLHTIPYLYLAMSDGPLYGTVHTECGCYGPTGYPERYIMNV